MLMVREFLVGIATRQRGVLWLGREREQVPVAPWAWYPQVERDQRELDCQEHGGSSIELHIQ